MKRYVINLKSWLRGDSYNTYDRQFSLLVCSIVLTIITAIVIQLLNI